MLDRLTALFDKKNPRSIENDAIHTPDEFHLAAAVLLVYAATSDADFDERENSQIEWLCENKFKLTSDEAHTLMEAAAREVDESVQLLRFTRTIKDGFSYEERINLIERLRNFFTTFTGCELLILLYCTSIFTNRDCIC